MVGGGDGRGGVEVRSVVLQRRFLLHLGGDVGTRLGTSGVAFVATTTAVVAILVVIVVEFCFVVVTDIIVICIIIIIIVIIVIMASINVVVVVGGVVVVDILQAVVSLDFFGHVGTEMDGMLVERGLFVASGKHLGVVVGVIGVENGGIGGKVVSAERVRLLHEVTIVITHGPVIRVLVEFF